jgi:hypothetical protein
MGSEHTETGHHFLPIGEAAKLLGLSRIRLREAIAKGLLPARRDNEGHLRVDLSAVPSDLDARLAGQAIEPAELLDTLFDEVEELQAMLAGRDADIERFKSLLDRQDTMLERSMELNERANRGRPQTEPAEEGSSKALADVSDRALRMLDDVTNRLETTMEHNAQFRQLVERALALSEVAASASDNRVEELSGAAERAMNLLDRALQDGESKGEVTSHLTGMLDRALAAGQHLEGQVNEKTETIRRQEKLVGKMIGMSERALGIAGSVQPRRRRWLGWLTGR